MYSIVRSVIGDVVRRDADGAFVPADPANVDWQDYQVWLAEGNAPAGSEPAPPASPVRQTEP